MNKKYSKQLSKRPLSTLTEEEYNMLKEMGLVRELYPWANDTYEDLTWDKFTRGEFKRQYMQHKAKG